MKGRLVLGAVVVLAAIAAGAGWWWERNRGPTDKELETLFQEEPGEDEINVRDIGNYLQQAPSDLPDGVAAPPVVSEEEVLSQNGSIMSDLDNLPQEQTVSVGELGFTPEEVTVPQGGKIRFVNNGQGVHEPTQENLEGFEAGLLQTGDSYTFVWDGTGEWTVGDAYNEEAKLRVVVE